MKLSTRRGKNVMKQLNFLGIAPYEELANSLTIVGEQFENISIDVFTGDLEEGQEIAQSLFHQNYDAIISRGGTANLIQQSVSIPVIDVSISVYDILGAIKLANNYTEDFVIIGYPSITETAYLLCNILQYNIRIITISETSNTESILETLKSEGCKMILCDAVTNKLAIKKSIDTILITSGIKSIKHAINQAISIVKDYRFFREQNSILTEYFSKQSTQAIIFNNNLDIEISNLDNELSLSIKCYLESRKDLSNDKIFYHSFKNTIYNIKTKEVRVNEDYYYFCEIKKGNPSILTSNFGIQFLNYDDINKMVSEKMLFTSFIQEKSQELMDKLTAHYNAIMIFGETGTAKTSLAYSLFLKQKKNNNNLITINSKLVNDKTWKYLVNATNGPFVEKGNTFLFRDINHMSLENLEKLLTIINSAKLLQRNNLLFTYTSGEEENSEIFDRIMTQLDCSSIYSPSLKERQSELSGIITLLLNKINIECHCEVMGLEPNAMEELYKYNWPRNFNQLEKVIKKLVINCSGYYISEHQVIEILNYEENSVLSNFPSSGNVIDNNKTLFDYEQDIIKAVLNNNNNNQSKTAKQLGISRTTLWRFLKMD